MSAGFLNGETVSLTGDNFVDAMTAGYRWQLDISRTVDWSFTGSLNSEKWKDLRALFDNVTNIFSTFSYYANINFKHNGGNHSPLIAKQNGKEINIIFDNLNVDDSIWGISHYPDPDDYNRGDIYINSNSLANSTLYERGSDGWFFLMHEIGHTLGLKHPHDDGGTDRPILNELGWTNLDVDFMTIMSKNYNENSNLRLYDPATPMILDVLALQYLYGKNYSTNAGDTIHIIQTRHHMFKPWDTSTIWDASGYDTVNQSLADRGWYIELPNIQLTFLVDTKVGIAIPADEYLFMSADYASPNISWLAGDIERLVGSNYSDYLYGNILDNIIIGGNGNDNISGGGGNDTIIAGYGIDTIHYHSNFSDYDIIFHNNGYPGYYTIVDIDGSEGIDYVDGAEYLSFSDQIIAISNLDTSLSIAASWENQFEDRSGGASYTFTVWRSGDTTIEHAASWAVTGSGANPAEAADFVGGVLPSGTVSFAAGETSKTITVEVADDTAVESDEGFTVTLSNPSTGLFLYNSTASSTILGNDATVSIAPVSANQSEGQGWWPTSYYTFTVTRAGYTGVAHTAAWAVTGSGSNPATASDFWGVVLPSGTVTFAVGETIKVLSVTVAGDTTVEADEGFTVTLSNPSAGLALGTSTASWTILNDDATVSIAAASASRAEGQAVSFDLNSPYPHLTGTAYTFTATRVGDTSVAHEAGWNVTGSGANAAAAADFVGGVMPSGTVYFAAGETSKTITVNVAGGDCREFRVWLVMMGKKDVPHGQAKRTPDP